MSNKENTQEEEIKDAEDNTQVNESENNPACYFFKISTKSQLVILGIDAWKDASKINISVALLKDPWLKPYTANHRTCGCH